MSTAIDYPHGGQDLNRLSLMSEEQLASEIRAIGLCKRAIRREYNKLHERQLALKGSLRAVRANAARTPEERSEASRKAWQTRRVRATG